MPRDVPDFRSRAELTELMDEPCSREELQACLRDLAKVNRWFRAYRPVLDWLDEFAAMPVEGPLRILDVGCGYGDGLRRIERWASAREIPVDLLGLDMNPDAVAIAAEASPATSKIEWISADVLAYTPLKPIHLVVSSLVAHHLDEGDLVRFLAWMEQRADLGWFINDLSRAPVPYHLFRVFAKVARLHPFVQHDGPVSIARAFVPEDWRRMCTAAGLAIDDVKMRAYTPARLCVGRRKRL